MTTSPVLETTFAAVLFDMDGTLIDSSAAVVRAYTQWAIDFGITAEQLSDFHGVPAADIVRALLPEEQWERAIDRINELELTELDDIVALPGAREALETLPAGRRAIATSSTRALGEARLGASGLPRPEVMVTVDDVTRGKPAPDPFLEAAARLGVDPAQCLVIEDAVAGLAGARAAGCATVAVVTTTPRKKLEAGLVVDNLAAVEFVPDAEGVRVRLR